ncbi:hypothetical protein [Pedobacter zeae]|uniref:Uncharacterized protein n=1 Tax=Pedobacter zeae TaxID=1737356 RepID=A0A7W6P3N4_9SPHI|nr:hypothetical protein [Pedobacter zeae]MBB4106654.1 hypothetical protein [Pedobacter zeae]GGH02949.1 hypothetical protein GCM10007422_17710 [Pedobacter zeae]
MQLNLIYDQPYLVGEHDNLLKKETKFGLEPGTKVLAIGRLTANGKQSSSCRLLETTTPIEYRGVLNIENESFLAFLIAPSEVQGTNLPVYKLFTYSDKGNELYIPSIKSQTIAIYKAVFKIAN